MKGSLIATVTGFALLAFSAGALAQDAKAEKGAKVYADQKCSLCHSVAGKGNAKGALDDVGSKLTTAEIHDWIVKPTEMAAKAKADPDARVVEAAPTGPDRRSEPRPDLRFRHPEDDARHPVLRTDRRGGRLDGEECDPHHGDGKEAAHVARSIGRFGFALDPRPRGLTGDEPRCRGGGPARP